MQPLHWSAGQVDWRRTLPLPARSLGFPSLGSRLLGLALCVLEVLAKTARELQLSRVLVATAAPRVMGFGWLLIAPISPGLLAVPALR
jgi:hypothetical protein